MRLAGAVFNRGSGSPAGGPSPGYSVTNPVQIQRWTSWSWKFYPASFWIQFFGFRWATGYGFYRPGMEGFPVGSGWIMAFNGPGAKPGKGLALSHCGEYWLRVRGDEAVGNFDGAQGERKRKPLSELRLRLRFPKSKQKFKGRVEAGARFQQAFGPGFQFVLEPRPTGWEIVILEGGREENLARLTPPLHFVPNPREIRRAGSLWKPLPPVPGLTGPR